MGRHNPIRKGGSKERFHFMYKRSELSMGPLFVLQTFNLKYFVVHLGREYGWPTG